MTEPTVVTLGALAGLTIFLGLPVARLRGLSGSAQGLLNAIATGVLIFLLVDILAKAGGPVHDSLLAVRHGEILPFAGRLLLYSGGLAVGLLGLTWFNRSFSRRLRRQDLRGPGAAVSVAAPAVPSGQALALMIATGLGLHNFSEGLAIGQSAAVGAVAFTGVLVMGFGLHNITEGFGIAAPLASATDRPSWGFLALAGLIGGGPTFFGTVIGYHVSSPYAFVLFLALAAGALIYVLHEMLAVCRRLNTSERLALGLLAGFLAGFVTDLVLTFAGG